MNYGSAAKSLKSRLMARRGRLEKMSEFIPLRFVIKHYQEPYHDPNPMKFRVGDKPIMVNKTKRILQQYNESLEQWFDVPEVDEKDVID